MKAGHLPKEELYVCCEQFDFSWTRAAKARVIEFYNRGDPIWDIAEAVGRREEEVAFLIVDLAASGMLKPRLNGAYGKVGERNVRRA